MNRHRAGFTLIEILVVVTLIAIMLTIAVPSFTSFISSYKATAAINEFLQSVVQARTEAMRQSRSMTMAPVTPGDWRSGWIIFHDASSGACPAKPDAVVDTAEQASVIFRHEALPTSITVANGAGSGNAFTDDSGSTYIAFDGTGFARQYCAGAQVGGIVMTNVTGSSIESRTLCLAAMGRARVVRNVYACNTGGY